jgi:Domain of unknown function (DUF3943)
VVGCQLRVRCALVLGVGGLWGGAALGQTLPAQAAPIGPTVGELLAPRHLSAEPPALTLPKYSIPTSHAFALMTGMRLSEAILWPQPFAETRVETVALHYREAFTRPPKWNSRNPPFQWDGDTWFVNAVGHPLFGSEVYLRTRSCGNSVWVALGFATMASTTWEYAIEASGVRPSALDLWFTPLSGMILGEGRYWGHRLAGRIDNAVLRGILKGLLDPFGEFERALGARC